MEGYLPDRIHYSRLVADAHNRDEFRFRTYRFPNSHRIDATVFLWSDTSYVDPLSYWPASSVLDRRMFYRRGYEMAGVHVIEKPLEGEVIGLTPTAGKDD